MSKRITMSMQTRKNWLIDAAVLLGGVLSALSAVYFLYLPSGGYEGGRNPMYGVTILFGRHTWGDIHTWGGVLMIIAVVVHFAIHWQWVVRMSKRVVSSLRPTGSPLSKGSRFNVVVGLVIALSFLVCAISGLYFLFAPSGGFQGGQNLGWDPGFLFIRTTWDLIHTWSGVVMIVGIVVHFAIHWRWVKQVTVRFFLSLMSNSGAEQRAANTRQHPDLRGSTH